MVQPSCVCQYLKYFLQVAILVLLKSESILDRSSYQYLACGNCFKHLTWHWGVLRFIGQWSWNIRHGFRRNLLHVKLTRPLKCGKRTKMPPQKFITLTISHLKIWGGSSSFFSRGSSNWVSHFWLASPVSCLDIFKYRRFW